ncbi:MAG TPA: GtrA family protein [Clostridia bacterium]|nr:GtrA family protein [Clostridia bacterium]
MFAKIKKYLNEHKNIFQLVKFAIFSMVAFLTEYISFALIKLSLNNVVQPVHWWIFNYDTDTGGLGVFIAFLMSNVLAQIISFILNRKKTFNANNNVWLSASMYAVMVLGIIILNTWMGGVLTRLLNRVIANVDICQYIGKLIGSFAAFVITFVMSKFVIMRRSSEPKSEAIAETDACECAEIVVDEENDL